MGIISLILRIAAAVILFLLAFQVITDDWLYWLAGALGLYVTATVFGPGEVTVFVPRRQE